jgi:cob(I)alamin adenosyltransferase
MSYLTTRKGDNGTTCIGGGRVPKTHPLVRLVGILDVVQGKIGLLHCYSVEYPYLKSFIDNICNDFYTIMGMVHKNCPEYLSEDDIEPFLSNLDKIIYNLSDKLPKMNQFIRPSVEYADANNVRAECRLHENNVLQIEEELGVGRIISPYLNRLSSVVYGFMIYIYSTSEASRLAYEKRIKALKIILILAVTAIVLVYLNTP